MGSLDSCLKETGRAVESNSYSSNPDRKRVRYSDVDTTYIDEHRLSPLSIGVSTLDLVPIQITLIRIKLVRIGYTLRPHMNRITLVSIPSH